MTKKRYNELMDQANNLSLTKEEMAEGWHWCNEWDGLLVGPGDRELECCSCLPPDHSVYLTKPKQEHENTNSR
jgi:hypothetical protein